MLLQRALQSRVPGQPGRFRSLSRPFVRLAALASALSWTIAIPAQAQEHDPIEACLSNHRRGQVLRRDNKLLESREVLQQCSTPQCPTVIVRDCLDWLQQLQRQIPSITFHVTADGVSRNDARIFIDGEPLLERQRGKALDLNPGIHRVRVLLPPHPPFESDVIVSEGDQFRIVEVRLDATAPPPPPVEPAPEPQPDVPMHRPTPIATYVFGGIGLAAGLSGAGWAVSSWSLRRDLEQSCAPRCRTEGINVLRQRALIADISFGVGAASMITAALFYALRPEEPIASDAVEVDVGWLPGGAIGTVSIRAF